MLGGVDIFLVDNDTLPPSVGTVFPVVIFRPVKTASIVQIEDKVNLIHQHNGFYSMNDLIFRIIFLNRRKLPVQITVYTTRTFDNA